LSGAVIWRVRVQQRCGLALLVDHVVELGDVVGREHGRQVQQVLAERGRAADLVLVDPVGRLRRPTGRDLAGTGVALGMTESGVVSRWTLLRRAGYEDPMPPSGSE